MLRILTFNWHEGYLCLLAKTNHHLTVVDKDKGGYKGWIHATRPVPPNVELLPIGSERAALERARAGEFDLAIGHNLQDLAELSELAIAKVIVFHNRLSTELELFRRSGQPVSTNKAYAEQFLSLFDSRTRAVFISRSKRDDAASIAGHVIAPGIDLDEYGGYRGDQRRVLRVGNFFTGRDLMLGQTVATKVLGPLPVTVLGINRDMPDARLSTSWEDLKEQFRSHRVYLNTTVDGYEDGYNLSMLEAMATGMPVVTTLNRTSPIRNGTTGYIDSDPGILHERLASLLQDAELARRLGEQARSSVAEEFPLDRFTAAWEALFEELLCQGSGAAARSPAISDETPSAAFEGNVGRLLRTKQWASARRLLEQERNQSPQRAGIFNLLGETYRLLGRDPEAAQSFWRAAWLNSSLEQARGMDPETWDGSLLEDPEKNPEVAALACICVGRGVDIGSGGSRIHPGAISIEVGFEGREYQGARRASTIHVSQPDITVSGYTLEMFGDEELDYVVSRHHLGDYQDPLRALEEWRRVLKKGGVLAFVLPDDSHIDTMHHDTSRRHAFTPDSFRRLIRYFGDFDILHEGPCFHYWSFVAVLQKRGGGGAVV